MYNLMGMNVELKYLNGKCVEMIGLVGNNWNCVEICWEIFDRKGEIT